MSETVTVSELLESLLRDCTLAVKRQDSAIASSQHSSDVSLASGPVSSAPITTADREPNCLAVNELCVHCSLPIVGMSKAQELPQTSALPVNDEQRTAAHVTTARQSKLELILAVDKAPIATTALFEIRIRLRSH